MKIGIVSTAIIAGEFTTTVKKLVDLDIELSGVYSRTLNKAEEFCENYGVKQGFDDYHKMLDSDIDTVYIASPNSLHVSYAKAAIKKHKHVLIEKPMALNQREVRELYELAKKHNVFIMEAMLTLAKKPLHDLKAFLEEKEITMVDFHYAKQSQKYQDYKKGEFINVFSSEFGGGAINDLGVYPLYPINYLFGELKNISAIQKNATLGADEATVLIGSTEKSLVMVSASKVCLNPMPSMIMTPEYIIEIPEIGVFDHVVIKDLNQNIIEEFKCDNLMMEDEIRHFYEVVKSENYKSNLYTKELAKKVAKQLEKVAKELKI